MSQPAVTINLEIKVPDLILPGGHIETSTLELTPSGQTSAHTPQTLSGEEQTHGLLRIQEIPPHNQSFVLRLIQRWRTRSPQPSGELTPKLTTSTMAFSLKLHTVDQDSDTDTPIQPGLNHVIILLDAQGQPAGYSIDGAES